MSMWTRAGVLCFVAAVALWDHAISAPATSSAPAGADSRPLIRAGSLAASPEPGQFEQALGNAQHNNWACGPAVSAPEQLWCVEIKREPIQLRPVHYDGVFYTINDGRVRGYDAQTGREVFTGAQVGPFNLVTPMGLAAEARRLHVLFDRTLTAYDRADGRELWRQRLAEEPAELDQVKPAPLLYGDLVVVVSDRKVHAFEAASGKPAWEISCSEKIAGLPCAGGGLIVVGCYPSEDDASKGFLPAARTNPDACLRALNAATGELVWEKCLGKGGHSQSPAIWGDQVLTFQRHGGKVVARRLATGETIWERDAAVEPRCAGLAVDGQFVLGGGKPGNRTFALSAPTGQPAWTTDLAGYNGEPAIIAGDCAYVSGTYRFPYQLRCLRLRDGKELWSKDGGVAACFTGGKLLCRFYDPQPGRPERAGKGYLVCFGQAAPQSARAKP